LDRSRFVIPLGRNGFQQRGGEVQFGKRIHKY
jgi:hypothetical protein